MIQKYVVFSKQLAIYLRKRGFDIIKVGVNDKYPQYDVYIFIDSQELRQAISDYNN